MRSRLVRAGASLREKNARQFSQGPRGKEYAVRVSDFMQQVILPPLYGTHTRLPLQSAHDLAVKNTFSLLFSTTLELYCNDADVCNMREQHVYGAAEKAVWKHAMGPDRWQIPAVIEELKAKAKSEGLWNLWMAPYLTAPVSRCKNMRHWQKLWALYPGHRRSSTVRLPTPETWKF